MDEREQFKELLYKTVLNMNAKEEDAIKENLKLQNWTLNHLNFFDLDLAMNTIFKI